MRNILKVDFSTAKGSPVETATDKRRTKASPPVGNWSTASVVDNLWKTLSFPVSHWSIFRCRAAQKGPFSFRTWMIDGPFRALSCNYKMNDAFLFQCTIYKRTKNIHHDSSSTGQFSIYTQWSFLIQTYTCKHTFIEYISKSKSTQKKTFSYINISYSSYWKKFLDSKTCECVIFQFETRIWQVV